MVLTDPISLLGGCCRYHGCSPKLQTLPVHVPQSLFLSTYHVVARCCSTQGTCQTTSGTLPKYQSLPKYGIILRCASECWTAPTLLLLPLLHPAAAAQQSRCHTLAGVPDPGMADD